MTQWEVDKCPFEEECSAKSWQKAYVKSQTSEEHCRKILWYHCTVSSLHEKRTREDICFMCQNWPVEVKQNAPWPNADERFLDCDLSLPDPADEEAHKKMLDELVNAKKKLGDTDGPIKTPWDELPAISGPIGIRPRAPGPGPSA